jgi:hypothetical protein
MTAAAMHLTPATMHLTAATMHRAATAMPATAMPAAAMHLASAAAMALPATVRLFLMLGQRGRRGQSQSGQPERHERDGHFADIHE